LYRNHQGERHISAKIAAEEVVRKEKEAARKNTHILKKRAFIFFP
jgi:hypothetical protein